MKRVVLSVFAALGVAAGLAVTATSTSDQAYQAGMRGLALAAIVVVLEVTNVLGTWVLLTDDRTHAKAEAGVFVALASVVTGWFGCLSFGAVGLVGPVFVLAGVELARLASTTPTAPPEAAAHPAPVPAHRHAATPAPPAPPPPPPAPAPSEPPTAPMRRPTLAPWEAPVIDLDALPRPEEVEPVPAPEVEDEVEDEPAPPRPASDKGQLDDEDILAALAQVPDLPSRDALKAAYRVGTRRADRLLAQARANRRPRLVAAPEENR